MPTITRLLALLAHIVAVVLFVIVATSSSAPAHLVDWGFVAVAAGLALTLLP